MQEREKKTSGHFCFRHLHQRASRMKTAHSLVLLAGVGRAVADKSGSFDILSMNVAGLPPIFNGNDVPGDKATNSRIIGSYFAKYGYDIIHVQEVG